MQFSLMQLVHKRFFIQKILKRVSPYDYWIQQFSYHTVMLLKSFVSLTGIPLQTGKVAIVTGGAAGIGYYVTKGLVAKNVHVIIGIKPLDT